MAPPAVYVGYVIAALALLALVYSLNQFDLRGIGKISRRRPLMAADEADYEDEDLERRADYARPEQIMIVPRADLAVLIALFGVLGVGLGAVLGFVGPRAIHYAFASGDAAAGFSWRGGEAIERVAQIAGAMCFGLIALRMIRLFIVFAGFAAFAIAAHAAVAYTLGRAIWTPLGL
ncbi:MAG: hypothetical protein MRY74_02625 [Neomegalonema sp.]|nr:hypothetical protein [Neomegalonema sp.]